MKNDAMFDFHVQVFTGDSLAESSALDDSRLMLFSVTGLGNIFGQRLLDAHNVVSKQLLNPAVPLMFVPLDVEMYAASVEVYAGVCFVPFRLWSLVLRDASTMLVNQSFVERCFKSKYDIVDDKAGAPALVLSLLPTLFMPVSNRAWFEGERMESGLLVYGIDKDVVESERQPIDIY